MWTGSPKPSRGKKGAEEMGVVVGHKCRGIKKERVVEQETE